MQVLVDLAGEVSRGEQEDEPVLSKEEAQEALAKLDTADTPEGI
jgi:hypothetical protein